MSNFKDGLQSAIKTAVEKNECSEQLAGFLAQSVISADNACTLARELCSKYPTIDLFLKTSKW